MNLRHKIVVSEFQHGNDSIMCAAFGTKQAISNCLPATVVDWDVCRGPHPHENRQGCNIYLRLYGGASFVPLKAKKEIVAINTMNIC